MGKEKHTHRRKKKSKRREKETIKDVSPDLEGFHISLNTFGEIESNYKIDELNQFLNKNLRDKKLNDPGTGNKKAVSGKGKKSSGDNRKNS